jgi:hypothetical protein
VLIGSYTIPNLKTPPNTKEVNGLSIERRKLSELVKAEWNPRRITTEQQVALQRSLKEFGTVEPIVVNKHTGNVVGGHQRLDALLAIGETETDVLVGEWDEAQEKVLNIALNKISGEWEYQKLTSLFEEIEQAGIDLNLTGFSELEIAQALNTFTEKGINDSSSEYIGMPEFDQQDKEAFRSILVHFKNQDDVDTFSRLTNNPLTPKTKSIWFPKVENEKFMDKRY